MLELKIGNLTISVSPDELKDLKTQIESWAPASGTNLTLDTCREILSRRLHEGVEYYALPKGLEHQINMSGLLGDCSFPSEGRPRQLYALAQLMQVADALNGCDAWRPEQLGEKGYALVYDTLVDSVSAEECNSVSLRGRVAFRTLDMAETAVTILGEPTINDALGAFGTDS